VQKVILVLKVLKAMLVQSDPLVLNGKGYGPLQVYTLQMTLLVITAHLILQLIL